MVMGESTVHSAWKLPSERTSARIPGRVAGRLFRNLVHGFRVPLLLPCQVLQKQSVQNKHIHQFLSTHLPDFAIPQGGYQILQVRKLRHKEIK